MSLRARPMVLRVAPAVTLAVALSVGLSVDLSTMAIGKRAVAAGHMVEDREESPRSKSAPIIVANGTCPASDTIWTAMASLVPHGALDALPRSATVDVSDLGETYRVRLVSSGVERMRVYRDVARDCEQRARFAAVFIVLTLMPPELLIDSPTRLPPAETIAVAPEPAAATAAAEPPRRLLQLELSALGDAAPAGSSSAPMTSAGGELRLSIGGGRLVALMAVGLQRRSDFTLGGVRAREQRIPFDLGVRWRHAARWIEVAGEIGLGAALFRTDGVSPVVARQETRVDLGIRGGITLRFGAHDARLAPIAGIHGSYFPRPYEIAMIPAGVVGQTPSLRVGATVGIAASF